MAAYKPERGRGHDDSPSRGDRSRKAAYKHPTGRPHGGSVSASRSHARKNSAGTDSPSEIITSKVTDAPAEGNHATRQRRNGVSSVERRKRGRKRGARSMGRYPLKQTIVKYMNATEKHQSPETVESNRRILNRLEHRYALLREGNPNLRPDPARWGEHEVTAVMLDMKNRGICHASQALCLEFVRSRHVYALLRAS